MVNMINIIRTISLMCILSTNANAELYVYKDKDTLSELIENSILYYNSNTGEEYLRKLLDNTISQIKRDAKNNQRELEYYTSKQLIIVNEIADRKAEYIINNRMKKIFLQKMLY